MRTLVVSDLHIGVRGERARLADPRARTALRAAAESADRLILLGDVLEFRQGPARDALASASRVLPSLAEGLGPGREVVIVPGNHDHTLLTAWAERRAAEHPPEPLGLSAAVDWRDGEPLAVLAGLLGSAGATVRASYPGIWLRDDVYATHGHYLERRTTVPAFERLAAGVMARMLGRPMREIAAAEDYEAVLAPIYAWMYASAQVSRNGCEPEGSDRLWQRIRDARGARRLGWDAAVAAVIVALNAARIGPVHRELTAAEFRRAALVAFGGVLESISAVSAYAIFGHTHRAGPLPQDLPEEWRTPTGAQLFNSGCWLHEPTHTGDEPDSPYRAGFAVELDDDGPPRLVNLLD